MSPKLIITSASLAACVVLSAAPLSHAETSFTKITTGPPVSDAARGRGVAWVDFDNDGDLDLYVSHLNGGNLLYRNDGDGNFTKITDGPIVNTAPGSFGASWADLDNDGRIDLFVSRQDNAPALLFRQASDSRFTQTTMPLGGFSFGSAWADYDNDGWLDLLVGDKTQSILWHNNGRGDLVPLTNTTIQTAGIGGVISWVDYDNDGDPDAFQTTSASAGPARLYRNDGQGVFTQITGPLTDRSSYSTGHAWGDFNNDRFPDVFVCRLDIDTQQSLPSFLFQNNGDGTFTQVEQSPFTTDRGFALSCSWADYDNDGWQDLFVSENSGSQNRLYRNNGDGSFSRVLSGPIATDVGKCAGNSWGDYDRNGFLDLFVATSVGSDPQLKPYLYHNDGNSNAWLTVKCVGTRSNRSAIGAKVRAKATINGKTFWQLREIHTGDGWSGNPLEAHFGLGNATNVETLRIEWPSGTVQEFHNVLAKQYKTVIEPARMSAASLTDTVRLTLHGGRAMQYDIHTSTNLNAWSLLTTITITNLDGNAPISDTNAPVSLQHFYRAVLR
jgi:hypothetical protein